MSPLGDAWSTNMTDVYKNTLNISNVNVDDKSDDEAIQIAIDRLQEELDKVESESDSLWSKQVLFSKGVTHLDARLGNADDSNVLVMEAFYKYLDVEQIGRIIDGDFVIQGVCSNPLYGPALCVIEYKSDDGDGTFKTQAIPPWEILYTASLSTDDPSTFSIPIALGRDFAGGDIRAAIYVDKIVKIPYGEEKSDFKVSPELFICAWEYSYTKDNYNSYGLEEKTELDVIEEEEDSIGEQSKLKTNRSLSVRTEVLPDVAEHVIEEVISVPMKYVRDIQIATDYDEIQSLKMDGFELICETITENNQIESNNEHLWSFHVLGLLKSIADVEDDEHLGVEDVIWVKCLKSMGAVPAVDGYDVLHDNDLTDPDNDYSIFLAVKIGPIPKFSKISMFSTNIVNEKILKDYVTSKHAIFRQAPAEISSKLGGPAGIYLEVLEDVHRPLDDIDVLGVGLSQNNSPRESEHEQQPATQDDLISHMTIETHSDQSDDDNDDDDGDDYYNDNDLISELTKQLELLSADKEKLKHENNELQKKSALFIAREKLKQSQQNAITKTAIEIAQQTYLEGIFLIK